MVEKTFNLTWNNHLANLSGLFEGLYKSGLLTDVTLACQGGTLKAHRLVLAACSPYFERVFKEHCGEQPVLILKGVAVEEMQCLLDFMYRGSIDVREDKLPFLINIATELEIRGLSADHQSDKTIPHFHGQRAESESKLPMNYTAGNTPEKNCSRSENGSSIQHIKIEDIEVEDDPMIIDTHEDNFEDPSPMSDNNIRHVLSASYRRETRFKGKKRVSVGRITRNSDFMNTKQKPPCLEVTFRSKNDKFDSKTDSCLDPTVPEIQVDHGNLQREKSDLLTDINDELKSAEEKSQVFKQREVSRATDSLFKTDKKQCKPYSCDLCTLAFTRASHLARHRRVHTGERPFACTICARRFARQDKLKQHLDSHLQLPRKRLSFSNELTSKSVPIKGKRGRPRKGTAGESALEEISKFGEFSLMLNETQSLNMKQDNSQEKYNESYCIKSIDTSPSKNNDNHDS